MSIFDSFLSPFRKPKKMAAPAQPIMDSGADAEPPQLTILRTLVIVYEPTMDAQTGKKLSEYMHWNKVEDLARGYMSDVLQASGELVRYQIVQRIDQPVRDARQIGTEIAPIGSKTRLGGAYRQPATSGPSA